MVQLDSSNCVSNSEKKASGPIVIPRNMFPEKLNETPERIKINGLNMMAKIKSDVLYKKLPSNEYKFRVNAI